MASPNDIIIHATGISAVTSLVDQNLSAGATDDTVEITAQSSSDAARAMLNSTVKAGLGDDSITIAASGANLGVGIALDKSTVDAGEGNNSIIIAASSVKGATTAVYIEKPTSWAGPVDKLLTAGAGNDTAVITAESFDTGTATGIGGGSSVDLGDGHNTLTVVAASKSGSAYGLYNSRYAGGILTGAGDDVITIKAQAGGTGTAWGIYEGWFFTGAGDDVLSIEARAEGAGQAITVKNFARTDILGMLNAGEGNDSFAFKAISTSGPSSAFDGGKVYMDTGNDTISIEAIASSSGTAIGVNYAELHMGEGDDSVGINVQSATGQALGLSRRGSIFADTGDDTVSVVATVSGAGHAEAVNISSTAYDGIDMGEGNNVVNLTAIAEYGGTARAMFISMVTAGAGDDTFLLTAKASGFATGLEALGGLHSLDAGNGNNLIGITAQSQTGNARSLQYCRVFSGTGNDTIFMDAKALGSGAASCRGTINVGDGANVIGISSTSQGGEVDAGGSIFCGADNDLVGLKAATLGTGNASGLGGGTVNMGAGNNELTIEASAENGSVTAINSGKALAGAGNDTVVLDGRASGTGAVTALGSGSIEVGDGTNKMLLNAVSEAGTARAMGTGTIVCGDGRDLVVLNSSTANGDTAVTLGGGSITLGNGINELQMIAFAGAGVANAVETGSIMGGSGVDAVYVGATTAGAGAANALGAGIVELGSGNDTLSVEARAVQGMANAVGTGKIFGGDGNDTIIVTAENTGAGVVNALGAGLIDTGTSTDGDVVYVSAKSGAGAANAVNTGMITGGWSHDSISLSAVTAGTGAAVGMHYSTVDLGGGNDIFTSYTETQNGAANGINSSTLRGGTGKDTAEIFVIGAGAVTGVNAGKLYGDDGNDSFSLTAYGKGNGAVSALMGGGILDGGIGDDALSLSAVTIGAAAKAGVVTSGMVYGGDGNDQISAMVNAGQSSVSGYVLQGSVIDGGNGNDAVTLQTHGNAVLASGASAQGSSVLGGAGNDAVHLSHFGPDAGNFTQSGAALTLDGGTNNAVRHVTSSYGTASLGDTLALEAGYASEDMLAKLASQVTVKNFESLLMDFSDASQDAVNLESLLDSVAGLRQTNSGMSLVLKGDTGNVDTVVAHGLLGAVQQVSVSVEGISGTFTHHVATYDQLTYDVYLQAGITIV